MNDAAHPWGALWFLYSRSWTNRFVRQLKRLKQPRYLIGAVAMGAYVITMLWGPKSATGAPTNPALLDARHLLSILGIAVALVLWWLAAPSENALAYSPAEVHFLFPAPVDRRTLVQARLFSTQASLLIQVCIWTLVLRRNGGELHGALRAIGLWILFTTIALHRLGATLARTNAPDAPKRVPVARILAMLFLAALGIAIARVAPEALNAWRASTPTSTDPALRVIDRFLAARLAIQTVLGDPLVHWLVWPITAATAPAFAHSAKLWFAALPEATAVLAAHYLWIIRNPQPFEELAIGASARFADQVKRLRRGTAQVNATAVRRWWNLTTTGNPAVALAWKNTTAAIRTFRPRALIVTLSIIAIIVILSGRGNPDAGRGALRTAFATTFISIFSAALLTAPAWFRLDLRHDLTHLAFLKTAPLPAHTIVATEILTAAIITTLGMTVLFAFPAWVLMRSIGGPLDGIGIVLAILGGAVALGAINLLHITLYNAVALWLPDWIPLTHGGSPTGGASVVGQVYITLLAILTGLGILLAVPVAAGLGIWLLLSPHTPLLVASGGALAAGCVMTLAEWLGLSRLLGWALDKLEPFDIPSAQT